MAEDRNLSCIDPNNNNNNNNNNNKLIVCEFRGIERNRGFEEMTWEILRVI